MINEELDRIIQKGDPATLLDALRWAVNDPNLGPELAVGLDKLIASGGNNNCEAVAGAQSVIAVVRGYLGSQEAREVA